MRLVYHDRLIEIDSNWAQAAMRLGMRDFSLAEDGFTETFSDNRPPLYFPKRLSAIYFWRAENGETYIGQAVDVQSRLRQHYKNHRDLVYAAFIPVSLDRLDQEERRLVALAETQFRMRNVKLVKNSASFRPLDAFLTLAEQLSFSENGNSSEWLRDSRREFPMLETWSRPKQAKFRKDAELVEHIQAAVSEFVHAAIPKPNISENRFWSVTYLGTPNGPLIRVNVGVQEVLTLSEGRTGTFVRLLCPTKLALDFDGPHYQTNSYASYLDWDGATALFESTEKMRPVRNMVVWLARHTTPLNSRSHCPWLYVPEITDRWRNLQ